MPVDGVAAGLVKIFFRIIPIIILHLSKKMGWDVFLIMVQIVGLKAILGFLNHPEAVIQ